MTAGHTYRVKTKTWERLEERAWEFSQQKGKPIKVTDLAETVFNKAVEKITLNDVEKTIENRTKK